MAAAPDPCLSVFRVVRVGHDRQKVLIATHTPDVFRRSGAGTSKAGPNPRGRIESQQLLDLNGMEPAVSEVIKIGEGRARLPRSAALIVSETLGVAGMSSADSEAAIARERKNARSLARFPKVANASAHSVRASTCGQSSSHV